MVPVPRPFARTLEDRSYVYQPNRVAGNKPVTIGHHYSVTAFLPEREHPDPPWVVPLSVRRVRSDEKAIVVGAEQVVSLLQDHRLPFQTAPTAQSIPGAGGASAQPGHRDPGS